MNDSITDECSSQPGSVDVERDGGAPIGTDRNLVVVGVNRVMVFGTEQGRVASKS